MLELAALGLLQNEPLHGYRLKQELEKFMGGCISVNFGTIYPLLKRLEKQGFVSVCEEIGESGSSRKIYSITETGRSQWQQRMMEHPQESWVNSRSRFLIKFFFFAHLESQERIKLLQHRLMLSQLRLDHKESVCPDCVGAYQTEVFEYITSISRREINWLQAQLIKEEHMLESVNCVAVDAASSASALPPISG